MKKHAQLCVVCAALTVLGACTPLAPAGALFGSGSSDSSDLVLLPNRSLYIKYEQFSRKDDLTVIVYNDDGTVTMIPTGDLNIGVAPSSSFDDGEVTMLPPQVTHYQFTSTGPHDIVVQYPLSGVQNRYKVQVIDASYGGGVGGGGGGNGNGNGSGVGVGWASWASDSSTP